MIRIQKVWLRLELTSYVIRVIFCTTLLKYANLRSWSLNAEENSNLIVVFSWTKLSQKQLCVPKERKREREREREGGGGGGVEKEIDKAGCAWKMVYYDTSAISGPLWHAVKLAPERSSDDTSRRAMDHWLRY